MTLADLLPKGSDFALFFDGQILPFEVLKRDDKKNLILLEIDKEGLPTCGFASFDRIKRGQRVFLIGTIFLNGKPEKMVNSGIIKYFGRDFIRTNIFELNRIFLYQN